ncbi:MAG: ribosome maturation factor RimM [Peptococcaceae bacterium]|nr:ribosome maturation factor RimM [Peptococcaceae bacterium]
MTGEFIAIGKILKAQGHRGAVRVLPLTDYPERFQQMSRVRVSVKGAGRVLNIEEVYPHKRFFIIKFREVKDMDAAEKLRGGLLEVTREELVPLPEGSFYIFDIIGLNVYDTGGNRLGEISDVLQTGANDVYVVKTAGRPLLIPALKQVVREVDLSGRRMVVELPEGLMD